MSPEPTPFPSEPPASGSYTCMRVTPTGRPCYTPVPAPALHARARPEDHRAQSGHQLVVTWPWLSSAKGTAPRGEHLVK